MSAFLRSQAARLAAIVILVVVTLLVTSPGYSSGELSELASKYRFERRDLASASHAQRRDAYPVQKQLAKIQAWISSLGAAVAITDADGDGASDDVCLVDPRTRSVTVAPAPGTPADFKPFLLEPKPLPYTGVMTPMGCTHGDFDEDGSTDFLVYYVGRTPVLYLHRKGARLGASAFAHRELVTPSEAWISDTVAQADVDGDGHDDLLVGNYYSDGARLLDTSLSSDDNFHMPASLSRADNGGGIRVFLWESAKRGSDPSVRYREDRTAIDPDIAHGWTVAIGAGDLNGDLLPDVYVANDMGPDRLLVNESRPGDPLLTPVKGKRKLLTPASKVLGTDSFKSMSAAFGDLTGDGRFDIFVSNITSKFALMESNFVWENTGGKLAPGATAPFKESSEKLDMARSGWAWDAKIGDFDNDGTPEVVQAVGYVKGKHTRWPEMQEVAMGSDLLSRHIAAWPNFRPGHDDLSGKETDAFWAKGPDGKWANVGTRVGMDHPMVSRGVALGDVDRDGRLDYALGNQWEQSYLFSNQSKQRPYLGLTLLLPPGGKKSATKVLGPTSRVAGRPAIGATARIALPNGRKLIQLVDGGNGHAGFSAQELLFGLGDSPPRQVTADITWRDGAGVPHKTSLALRPGWHTVLLEQR